MRYKEIFKEYQITRKMGQLFSTPKPPPPPLSKEDREEIIKVRNAYTDGLTDFRKKATDQKNLGTMSPDTAKQCYDLITVYQKWLVEKPEAGALEIINKGYEFHEKLQAISERELAKNQYLTALWTLKSYLNIWDNTPDIKKASTIKEYPGLLTSIPLASKEIDKQFEWIKKHPEEYSFVYTQQIDSLMDNMLTIFQNETQGAAAIEWFRGIAKNNNDWRTLQWWKIRGSIKLDQSNMEKENRKDFSSNKLTPKQIAIDSFTLSQQIFWSLIIFFLILMGGSIASNMAIGREWYYRVFFFIFGCNPYLTPIIYAYAALQALKGKSVRYYGVLPTSTDPAKTRLGKIIWWPFYYEADQEQEVLTSDFLKSLDTIAQQVKSMPKPPPVQISG